MAMNKSIKQVVHETADDLHKAGVMPNDTMKTITDLSASKSLVNLDECSQYVSPEVNSLRDLHTRLKK